MLGGAALLLLYLALIGRGLRIGLERLDGFGKLLALGLTTVFALQVFVIVGGVTRLIPLTGMPLPLVSYGGTSRVATFVMLALLVRISAGPWQRKVRVDRIARSAVASASGSCCCSRCCSRSWPTCRWSRPTGSRMTRPTPRGRSSPSTRSNEARS